jgi:hypothetical protein
LIRGFRSRFQAITGALAKAIVKMEQSATFMGGFISCREPPAHQPPKEFTNVVTPGDARESAVLTQHADA